MKNSAILEKVKSSFHLINRLGVSLLVDKDTGAVYKLDKEAKECLIDPESYPDDSLLEELYFILKENSDHKNKYIAKTLELEKKANLPKAFCLEVAHQCNMSCSYCFTEDNLDYSDSNKSSLMPFEIAKKAIDYLLKTPYPVIEIDFFGGEPLLNWEVVKKSINYISNKASKNNKKYYLALTTNGLGLTPEIVDFLNYHKVNLTLSLDGPPHIHDKHRHFQLKDSPHTRDGKRSKAFLTKKIGKGTFDIVFPKIKMALESRNYDNYYIRGTFTRETLNFSETAKFFINEGLKSFSLEPAVSTSREAFLSLEDLPQIETEYERLANLALKKIRENDRFYFYHFNLDIYNTPCFDKQLKGCGAGCLYLAIAPDGSIFPCHQLTGENEFLLGNIQDRTLNQNVINLFKKAHIFNKKDCLDCWAKFYCSGGCLANHYRTTGSLYKTDEFTCKLMKLRLEYALALKEREEEITGNRLQTPDFRQSIW